MCVHGSHKTGVFERDDVRGMPDGTYFSLKRAFAMMFPEGDTPKHVIFRADLNIM